MSRRVLIMGAAGRDFHDFNTYFRGNPDFRVVAFTATQIPNIEGRSYPSQLAGPDYPDGIPIYPEEDLERVILDLGVHEVVFSYSDVTHEHVMHRASRVLAMGADFRLLGPESVMLESSKPVVAVTAVRTGVGKSQTTRRVAEIFQARGLQVAVVRHPMPYGDLVLQRVQKFENYEDLDRHQVTIEEREEYEPHIDRGNVVFAGVDYEAILREVESNADVILWDGGNNDLPFYRSDLHMVLVDPHRAGHEEKYHPGETNLRMADVVVINKIDSASMDDLNQVRASIRRINPDAVVVEAASPVFLDDAELIKGKKVLVIEDGPTLTHGEMGFGAGILATLKFGGIPVDPRPWAVGSLIEVFQRYGHMGKVLPAMGYGQRQIQELEQTIRDVEADVVVVATPIDLRRIIKLDKPAVRVRYELQEIGRPTLEDVISELDWD